MKEPGQVTRGLVGRRDREQHAQEYVVRRCAATLGPVVLNDTDVYARPFANQQGRQL